LAHSLMVRVSARAEAREMRAAFVGVDVVHEGKRVVVVAVVILDRAFDDDTFSRGLERDRLGVQGLAVAEQMLHELGEAALVEERLLFLLSLALVLERDREGLGSGTASSRSRVAIVA